MWPRLGKPLAVIGYGILPLTSWSLKAIRKSHNGHWSQASTLTRNSIIGFSVRHNMLPRNWMLLCMVYMYSRNLLFPTTSNNCTSQDIATGFPVLIPKYAKTEKWDTRDISKHYSLHQSTLLSAVVIIVNWRVRLIAFLCRFMTLSILIVSTLIPLCVFHVCF